MMNHRDDHARKYGAEEYQNEEPRGAIPNLDKAHGKTEDEELDEERGPNDPELQKQEGDFQQLLEESKQALQDEEKIEKDDHCIAHTPGGIRMAMTPATLEDPSALKGKERDEMLANLNRLKDEVEEEELDDSRSAVERQDCSDEELSRLEKEEEALRKKETNANIDDRTEEEQRTRGIMHLAEGVPPKREEPRTLVQEDRKEETKDKVHQDGLDELTKNERAKDELEPATDKDKNKDASKENSLNRKKEVDAKNNKLVFGIAAGVVIILVLFIVVKTFSGGEAVKTPQDAEAEEADKTMKELRQVSPSDITGLKERDKAADQQNYDMPGAVKPEEGKTGTEKPTFAPSSRGANGGERRASNGGPSKNFEKDKDIIEQYKDINPAAASGGMGGEGSGLRYRPRPFAAGSGNDTKGGVTYTNQPTARDGGDTGALPLHDMQVRARLKFSIRSSASNQITAVSDVDLDGLPAGAIFYGQGNFSNKRTYVQFNKVRSGDREYSIKAYAVSGKDPGIASEVIEIENNTKITFTSGVVDVTGKVLDNLAATATGGATSGVVSGTAGEVKDKNEAERARYEYRVGAGTGFIVYIE